MRRTGRLALLGLALWLTACDAEPEQQTQPVVEKGSPSSGANVIVVMTDDQSAREMEALPRVRELLGDRGTEFANAITSFPLCCPSRATFLTGRYAHNHGVLSNDPDFDGGYGRLHHRHTLPVWLQEAGYDTAQIGRYLNFYGVLDPTEVPPGWDEWVVPPARSAYVMYDYDLNVNGELVHYGNADSDYGTDVLGDYAVPFVEDQAESGRPFFMTVTTLAPHDENDEAVQSRFEGPRPAERHHGALGGLRPDFGPAFNEEDVSDKPGVVADLPALTPQDRRRLEGSYLRRARSLLAVDDLFAEIVAALRGTGQLRETYIFFTSDNGYLLGEHRLHGKIAPYEESVKVPLLVRGPGVREGAVVDGVVSNVDLAPTILELAGAAGHPVDGISLVPALEGRPERRPPILLENLDRSQPDQPTYAGIRTQRWAYYEVDTPGGVQLYDLSADPGQLENLAADPGQETTVDRMARLLNRLRDCRGASCR